MPFFDKNGYRYLFIHVPKTGGTSVEMHLQKYSKFYFHYNGYPLPDPIRVSPQHWTINNVRAVFGSGYWKAAFSVVRNPFTRIESEFRFQKRFYRRAIKSFDLWLPHALDCYRKEPCHADNHLRPQYEFLDETVRVFKYEDGLDVVIRQIEELMEFQSNQMPPRMLSTDSEKIVWTEENMCLVRSVYKRDFEYLGYPETELPIQTGPASQ